MEIADAEAEAGRGLESAGGGMHTDCRGSEGIVGWEHEGAPVLAVVVGCLFWTGDYVVPPMM